ncbi:MAG: 4'-phosphopantetheinyl transferase superfamily protein [Verrucomicrobiota bacterium]
MRCGIDTVPIERVEKLVADHGRAGLAAFFSERELDDAGENLKAETLAGRFAAKEACAKLFPREIGLGAIEPVDFAITRDGYGAPEVAASERAEAVMNRHRIEEIRVSITHSGDTATAIATAAPVGLSSPWYGKLIYRLAPLRRSVVLENMSRVFGKVWTKSEIRTLAERYYAHFGLFFVEFFKLAFTSSRGKAAMIRIDGGEVLTEALEAGRGVLLLTGHFGNWEVSTVAGIAGFEELKGRFHFIRKPLKPAWFNSLVLRRFHRAGFGTIEKADSLDEILDLLDKNHVVVATFDQFAIKEDGTPSEFFGHPAHTFRSLAVLARVTQSPVVPASSWREPDGKHVLRFEKPLEIVSEGPTRKIVKENTRRFNQALERIILRHPEQWIWMHKRWKKV